MSSSDSYQSSSINDGARLRRADPSSSPLTSTTSASSISPDAANYTEVRTWQTFSRRNERNTLHDAETAGVTTSLAQRRARIRLAERSWRGVLRSFVGTAAALQERVIKWGVVVEFVDSCLRGLSEIFFASNPITGLVILVASLASSWYIGIGLLIGVVVSTATTHVFEFDAGSRRAGLLGYSGALTAAGVCLFTFGSDTDPFPQPWMLLPIVVVSALACVLTVALGSLLAGHLDVAPFTLPFHAALWAWLLLCQQSAYFHVDGGVVAPRLISVPPVMPDSSLLSYDGAQVIRAIFTSVSQVVFIENPYAGAAMLVGLAAYSWISAVAALLGAILGVVGALALGIPGAPIYAGLWGYNPCLVSIAIGGVFFVPHGIRTGVMWLLAVLSSVVVHGAIGSALAPIGMPALTFPAAITCVMFCLLAGAAPNIIAVQLPAITVPEDHRRRFVVSRAVMSRLSHLGSKHEGLLGNRIRKDMLNRVEEHLLPALLCSLTSSACGVDAEAAASSKRQLEDILRCGADASSTDYDLRAPLHVSACADNVVLCSLLLQHGADTDSADRFGSTPLLDAVLHRSAGAVDLLVRRGETVAASTQTAMLACTAASRNDVASLLLLLRSGCSPDVADYDHRTPLHLAAASGHETAVVVLLHHGASLRLVDRYGETPRVSALHGHHARVVEVMDQFSTVGELPPLPQECLQQQQAQQASVDRVVPASLSSGTFDDLIRTVLLCDAASTNDCDALNDLLDSSSDAGLVVSSPDYDGRTPLHVAAAEGADDAVSLLCERGASLTVRDRWGMTPLMSALLGGHVHLASILSPAPVAKSKSSTSALLVVEDAEASELSRINDLQMFFLTQLVCDMASHNDQRLPLLYRFHAIPKTLADYDGRTPLHIAFACGNVDLAEELIRASAPRDIRDRWGRLPEDDAPDSGFVVQIETA